MAELRLDSWQDQERRNWLPLRTLLVLRWFAVAGQSIALVVAEKVYGLQISFALAALTVGALVVANVLSSVIYAKNKRLSEFEASLMLVFDILQLSALLFLIGGLNNPFALLYLAPVTIAASVLRPHITIILGMIAITAVTLLSRYHYPILLAGGRELVLPGLFQFGFWVALVVGVVFLAIYARLVTTEMTTMSDALLATQLALSREQKLTDLGGVVAAAAHELGTPLATIKLVSSELITELADRPDLLEDVNLIREQANRCRDILLSMGRTGKDDLHLRQAPLEAVVREAAEPHIGRGKRVNFHIGDSQNRATDQPIILRRPEIIHGLRNLIQNAVDFSKDRVDITVTWSDTMIGVRIADNGQGFPQSVIGRIGDPFVRRRSPMADRQNRPEYEGMGLGLFIAKTLLERAGATLSFENDRAQIASGQATKTSGGAIVTVLWRKTDFGPPLRASTQPLGENQPITTI